MNNGTTQICLVLFLVVFASCKLKEDRGQANTRSDQTENGLKGKLFTKADIDTIITQFAPARITRKVKQDAKGNLLLGWKTRFLDNATHYLKPRRYK
ncbi:MAG: hypothetical protein Sapg2KO_50770 [Saprospiraceae bacterium]